LKILQPSRRSDTLSHLRRLYFCVNCST
jgi:hypothetical protein